MAHILIVDTQAAFLQPLVSRIEQAGHSATVVAIIAEATRILEAVTPDLLATDVTLTDGSSTDLVQEAVELHAKTLMMMGNPDRTIEFDRAGRPYLSKPFTPELFVQRVEEVLAAD
jgi:DNA-binding response OmpR family regulator